MKVRRKTLKQGLKKLRSLVRIKIELAEDHGTREVDVRPLPVVRDYYGVDIRTVEEAREFYERELIRMHRVDTEEVPKVVFSAFDVIEGVKHEFEPRKLMYQGCEVDRMEDLKLDIMTDEPRAGAAYVGEPPEGVDEGLWVGRVVSVISRLLPECVRAGKINRCSDVEGFDVRVGRFTLLNYVTAAAFDAAGATVSTAWTPSHSP